MEKLVLIDGNSLINRAFYATPPMSAKDGTPTNAVFAFVNMLVKMIGDVSPSYMLVAFDRKEPTFRHLMYGEYKGTRKPMPDDLRPQIDVMKKLLDALGIRRYEKAGIEADDIIGSAAKKFSVPTVIITGDKDSFQLVDETTSVYFTRRGISELDVYSNENFKEKTGIEPLQIIDLKSMMGDNSDNIPGIAGVGEKTAISLVQTYGTLENMYDHIGELKGKLKEKAENSREIAFLSKKLATIDTSQEIPFSLGDLAFSFPFPYSAKTAFLAYDLRSLVKREDIFAGEEENGKTAENRESEVLPETVEAEDLSLATNIDGKNFVYVSDENGVHVYDGKKEYCFRVRKDFFDRGFGYDEILLAMKTLFEREDNHAVVYGKKDLRHELDLFGIALRAKADDCEIENYLAEFDGKQETAKDLAFRLGIGWECPAFALFRVHEELSGKLESDGMGSLYRDLELPLADVLYEMEVNGFKIDVNALDRMSADFGGRIKVLLDKIREIAGEPFNPNSPKQLGVVLFEKLGLKAGKKTKSGYSTNADVLESLEDEHEIVPMILEYRRLQKLYSTYIEGFRPLIDKKTGLVHTCFNQTLTTTGRLSSKEPNLQNIPVRDKEGKEIRKLFVSSFENGKIVGADYSQIELRLLAHFSGCKPLIDAYLHGDDIHALTASQVFGVPLDSVTPEMRRNAKAVNFGIIYGISDFGLAKQLKISPKKAGEYIKKYFETYSSVKEYMDSNVAFAKEHGYVKTMLGRKRMIPEINSPNFNLRSFGERAAMNMPLQGTAADIIKIAMLGVAKRLKEEKLKSKLILQVHDELLIDTEAGEVEQVKKILKEEMEGAASLSVPLTVETECGDRWFDAK